MIGFRQNFEFFPEALGSLKLMFYDLFDVLEPQEHPQSDSGSIRDHLFFHHFHRYFHDFSQTCELYISGALYPFPLKLVQIFLFLDKENTTQHHYLFLFIAPLKKSIQVQKITKNIEKMRLGAWEQNLRLVPGCRRITLTEHWKMLYESFKYYPRGPPQATHASA